MKHIEVATPVFALLVLSRLSQYLYHIMSTMDTRKSNLIPHLEEQPLEEILGSKCPKNREVFRYFYFLRYVQNKPVREAMKIAVRAAWVFWLKGGLKIKSEGNAIKDLDGLFQSFKVASHIIIKSFNQSPHKAIIKLLISHST